MSGRHVALLRLLAFAATRFVSGQFHVERGLPLASFCLALGVLDPLGLAALSWLFAGASPFLYYDLLYLRGSWLYGSQPLTAITHFLSLLVHLAALF